LVFSGILLGFGLLCYGVSKGKIYYEDFEARHKKSEFVSDLDPEQLYNNSSTRVERYSAMFGGRWQLTDRVVNNDSRNMHEHEDLGELEMTELSESRSGEVEKKDKTEGEVSLFFHTYYIGGPHIYIYVCVCFVSLLSLLLLSFSFFSRVSKGTCSFVFSRYGPFHILLFFFKH
jgi:hypothetical protein